MTSQIHDNLISTERTFGCGDYSFTPSEMTNCKLFSLIIYLNTISVPVSGVKKLTVVADMQITSLCGDSGTLPLFLIRLDFKFPNEYT